MRKLLGIIGAVIVAGSLTPAPESYAESVRTCENAWKPVCARTRRNVVARYANECFALSDGALVIGEGSECRTNNCPAVYQPVCARVAYARKGGEQTPFDPKKEKLPEGSVLFYANKAFFNECAAKEKGATLLASFADARYRYSIRQTDNGRPVEGAYEISSVCPTTCPTTPEQPLICGADGDGKERLMPNRCTAVLQGTAVVGKYPCRL